MARELLGNAHYSHLQVDGNIVCLAGLEIFNMRNLWSLFSNLCSEKKKQNVLQKTNSIKRISREEINKLPLFRYTGKIVMVRSNEELNKALTELKEETLLGFDTETRPAFRKHQSFLPSLLQLASREKVYLLRLADMTDFNGLIALLEKESVIKSGIALDQDVKKLNEIFTFKAGGFVDLGKIAQMHKYQQTGLRNLCAMLLGFRLSKGSQVTDWSKPELSSAQIHYAATDAWVSRELYVHMSESSDWDV
ncbi:MAG: 3'-5' exonuclease [Verrucomicrobiota bacterium]